MITTPAGVDLQTQQSPAVPKLPDPPADLQLHWLSLARQWATLSTDPLYRSGAVTCRGNDRFMAAASSGIPRHVRSSSARSKDPKLRPLFTLSAEGRMIAAAANQGRCLDGSICYIWPAITSAADVSLLIDAGCIAIVTPDFQPPSRLHLDLQVAREMTLEAGVSFTWITAPPEIVQFAEQ